MVVVEVVVVDEVDGREEGGCCWSLARRARRWGRWVRV